MTSHPHLAGTPADLEQAEQLKQIWLDQGLDRVDIVGYNVLLSYPKEEDPSIISLVQGGHYILVSLLIKLDYFLCTYSTREYTYVKLIFSVFKHILCVF